MSKLRIVVSLVFVALIIGCAASSNNDRRIVRSRTAASIAVRGDGSVDQETVTLQARNGLTGAGTPIPSQIVWASDAGTTLMIEWLDPQQTCVINKHCSGNVCSGLSNTAVTGRVECQYRVWINNTAAHDPIVVVDNCCP